MNEIAVVEFIMISLIGHSHFKITFIYTNFKRNNIVVQCICNKHNNNCVFFIFKSYLNNYNQKTILFNYIHKLWIQS